MPRPRALDATTRARPGRLAVAVTASVVLHLVFVLLLYFDVVGIGGGFGIGIGPGVGIGSGGGVGLGQQARRQIFSLEDLPDLVRPQDAKPDEDIKDLLVTHRAQVVVVPQNIKPRAVSTSTKAPVVQFARPVRPAGTGTDLGSRFAAAGSGTGGLGMGGGGGGFGISLGTAFGKYVGTLRKGGLDVVMVVDASGSMQMVIDDLKRRLGDMAFTLQRLVPSARIGAVVYRDKDDGKTATAPRQSEDFVVKWSDLTFNTKKVQSFFGGIVAEGGGDWKEAVKDGLDTAIKKLSWRADAKKVIVLIGSSPPHDEDLASIRSLISGWTAQGGIVSTVDVSQRLHEEHERKLHKWLYGDENVDLTSLPDFYAETRASFDNMARQGGGDSVELSEGQALMRHVLVLAFGSQWEKDVTKVARSRS